MQELENFQDTIIKLGAYDYTEYKTFEQQFLLGFIVVEFFGWLCFFKLHHLYLLSISLQITVRNLTMSKEQPLNQTPKTFHLICLTS